MMLDAKAIEGLSACNVAYMAAVEKNLVNDAVRKSMLDVIAPHLPELLARAAAWERVRGLSGWDITDDGTARSVAGGMEKVVAEFDRLAAKGFAK